MSDDERKRLRALVATWREVASESSKRATAEYKKGTYGDRYLVHFHDTKAVLLSGCATDLELELERTLDEDAV